MPSAEPSTTTSRKRITEVKIPFAGGHLRCHIAGEGPPLLFNNGIGASLDLLEPLHRALRHTQLIMWDAPGIGGSTAPRCIPSIPYVARAACRVLDRLDIERADVVGLSWGGFVAQELAISHRRRVRGLVLAATATGFTSRIGDPRVIPMMLSNRRYRSPDYLVRMAPLLYGGDIGDQPELLRSHAMLRHRHAPSQLAYTWQALATARWTSLGRLWTIRTPCLVMGADDDPISHIDNSRLLARRIPTARLEVIPRGGHLFLLTRAIESARIIEDFLAGIAEPRPHREEHPVP